MGELDVALGVQDPKVKALDQAAAVDACLLGGDPDPRVSRRHQIAVKEHPAGADVDATRYVVPLGDDGSREPLWINGSANDDARGIRCGFGGDGVPPAVLAAFAFQGE